LLVIPFFVRDFGEDAEAIKEGCEKQVNATDQGG
jgi:hypothetical protein